MRWPVSRWRCMRALATLSGVLAAMAGCSGPSAVPTVGRSGAGITGKIVIVARGKAPGWRLAAQEWRSSLCLTLEDHSGRTVSTACGFSAAPSAGFWVFGEGPGEGMFIYGPAPSTATRVRLTALGYRSFEIPTTLIPHQAKLPRGRFYVTMLPGPYGPTAPLWQPTALNADGHRVPFADF
jgi:hypothetical protein